MVKEARYQVTVEFVNGKGEGLDPVFEFWLNEEVKDHGRFLVKMLEAAACERWGIPMFSMQYTGEDFISIVNTFKVKKIYRNGRGRDD